MIESSIHERTKQSQKTEKRKNKQTKKTNHKLVGYGTSLGKWHFVWGRKKQWFRQYIALGQEIGFILRHFLSNYCTKLRFYKFKRAPNADLLSCVFAIPWTVACQVPLSMEFSRQEYWIGLPFPSPRGLPNPGIEPGVSCIADRFSTI